MRAATNGRAKGKAFTFPAFQTELYRDCLPPGRPQYDAVKPPSTYSRWPVT